MNKVIDFKNLLKNYKGKWVALEEKEKKIIASGVDAKKVYKEALEKGAKVPTLFKVPTRSVAFVGVSLKCNFHIKLSK